MKIRDFVASDQAEAAEVVLAGLEEHFGWRDSTLNPDLRDIANAFRGGCFLVGVDGGRIIATGGLLPHGSGAAEVVRMSVVADLRRRGLGAQMLEALCDRAMSLGFRNVMLETTATWSEVVSFYESEGFDRTHEDDGEVYFSRDLVFLESN